MGSLWRTAMFTCFGVSYLLLLIHAAGLWNHSQTAESLVKEYSSSTAPPPGFSAWLEFAKRNKCHLGPYPRIEKDLQVFQGRITKAQIRDAAVLPRMVTLTVQNGNVSANYHSARIPRLLQAAERFQKYLPDMELVINDLDEPRILPGEGVSTDARFYSSCRDASEDFLKHRHLHGAFNNRNKGDAYIPDRRLLPVFSQTKINECHADITFPSVSNRDAILASKDLVAWKQRNGTLFFRGSTTGGYYCSDQDYRMSHRHRLVDLAKHSRGPMDIAFTDYLQCAEVCKEMESHYGKAESVGKMENFKYKYLMVVDGNTHVGRLPQFLSSGSLVFRAGIFSDWFGEAIKSGQHFLQVKLDFSDLETKLQWALQHDEEARKIGLRAQEFARKRLRNEDMECYLYRLLLEYHNLVEIEDLPSSAD